MPGLPPLASIAVMPGGLLQPVFRRTAAGVTCGAALGPGSDDEEDGIAVMDSFVDACSAQQAGEGAAGLADGLQGPQQDEEQDQPPRSWREAAEQHPTPFYKVLCIAQALSAPHVVPDLEAELRAAGALLLGDDSSHAAPEVAPLLGGYYTDEAVADLVLRTLLQTDFLGTPRGASLALVPAAGPGHARAGQPQAAAAGGKGAKKKGADNAARQDSTYSV